MEKHPNTKLISSYMWKDYSTNMSQIQINNFLALVIPKAWKYTVLVEAHDKLGHQGATCTYWPIKCQYYWKGMNKDLRKYIAQCTLCHREKAKVQAYPLQMTKIPEWPFHKIAIDLVTECETSSSGNKHILTIISHLTGWLEAFPIPDKSADTIVSMFIKHYLQESSSWIKYFNNLALIAFFHTLPPSKHRKLEVFHKYLKPTLKKLCEKDPSNCEKYINHVLASCRVTPNLATAETPFSLIYGRDPNLPLHKLLEPMRRFPRWHRSWLTQPRSTSSSPNHCQETLDKTASGLPRKQWRGNHHPSK